VVLLDLLHRFAPEVPVYFLDTGYHFPETLRWRDALAVRFGLRVVSLRSPVGRLQQRDRTGRLLFVSDPDHCCHLNKVLPLEPIILSSDVWVSGVRSGQTSARAQMGWEGTGRHGIVRFHPLIDWDARMVHQYVEGRDLPVHPLDGEGFISVGCQPCTRRWTDGLDTHDRGGRWLGSKKTECGLHTGVKS
jgi:phosphoadenosine phosphosulfate reductase